MFWLKKKEKCKHEWHHLKDSYITSNAGSSIDLEDACWILCVKCEDEKLVYLEEWERIVKRQTLLKKYSK